MQNIRRQSQCRGNTNQKTIYAEILEEELPDFATKCKPPPPPGNEDFWELQFCRWWGWNWVRKKDAEQMKSQSHYKKRRKKDMTKNLKDLCNCLCFKKRPRETPHHLHNLYKTPSNSVMCLCKPDRTETENEVQSMSCLEVRKKTSRKSRKERCSNINFEAQRWVETSSRSSNVCGKGNSSQSNSTETRIEYLNASCTTCACKITPSYICRNMAEKQCKCQQTQEKQTKYTDNNQTQTSQMNVNNTCQFKDTCPCATQTKSKKPTVEKKCIKLLCCHCCCNCKQGKNDDGTRSSSIHYSDNKPLQVYQCKQKNLPVNFEQPVKLNRKLEMEKPLINYRPWDAILYKQKSFQKFGNPSRPYPWIESTKSNILDYSSSFKLDKEFSSPISGKIYRLEPIKVRSSVHESNSLLPDPIEIKDDVNFLKKIEDKVKPNFQSHVMLDAICDAILCQAKESVQSSTSTFLHEHTFASNTSSNIKQIDPFMDVILKESQNQYINTLETINKHEESMHKFKDLLKNVCNTDDIIPENDEQSKYKLQQAPIEYSECAETPFGNLFEETIDNCIDSILSSENLHYFADLDQPCCSNTCPLSLGSNTKRRASPSTSQPSKKFKKSLDDNNISSSDSLEKNVNKLFSKIDEVAVKSKVNTERIKEVIESMPHKINIINVDKELQSDLMNETPTTIFGKIDEIVTRSKVNDDTLENVMYPFENNLNNERRDYVNTDLLKHQQTSIIEKRLQIFTMLTTITEQPEEKMEGKEENCTYSISETDLDDASFFSRNCNEIKKPLKKSMIPVKKGSSMQMNK